MRSELALLLCPVAVAGVGRLEAIPRDALLPAGLRELVAEKGIAMTSADSRHKLFLHARPLFQ